MKNFLRLLGLVMILLGVARGQDNVPADLLMIASAGGQEPWEEVRSLRIAADGSGSYSRFPSNAFEAPASETQNFTLTSVQLGSLWQAIQANNFFNLPSQHSHPAIIGRTFAVLTIRANGVTHRVRTQNLAVAPFDNIMQALNDATPANADLIYDISAPPVLEDKDPCAINDGNLNPWRNYDLQLESSKLSSAAAAPFPELVSSTMAPAAAHPGTMLSCELSLQEAVNAGLVELSAKGRSYGDGVAIKVNNGSNRTCNNLTLRLFLEFWGEDASYVEAFKIQNAIQSYWNGYTTTDGKSLTVLVEARVSPGSDVPPGTPGYHQIQLVDEAIRSHAYELKEVNQGTGGGLWEVGMRDAVYAHEAGHLMGLSDRYYEYDKQPDGSWVRTDGVTYTADEFANLVQSKDPVPPRTIEEIMKRLDEITTGALPWDGHETDLMGDNRHPDDRPVQSDIDSIAADPGLAVVVTAGSVLANRSTHDQNLVVTRSEFVYAGPGETRQLNGIYAACIDYPRSIPNPGQIFDVAPHLAEWKGIAGTPELLQIVQYVDQKDMFCELDVIAQGAIWRITDNFSVNNLFVKMIMDSAGVDVGETYFDFPHIDNPNQSNGKSVSYVPKELYSTMVLPQGIVTTPGTQVNLMAKLFTPDAAGTENITTTVTWSLVKPSASNAALSSMQGNETSFFADVRGVFKARHTAQVNNAPGQPAPFQVESKDGVVVAADQFTETFESGALSTGGLFRWQTYGDSNWQINETEPHSGKFTAASGLIKHNQESILEIPLNIPQNGEVAFAVRVSSDPNDQLIFFIDETEQKSWSGEISWQMAAFSVNAGSHLLKWIYRKDNALNLKRDRVWIDDVFFPPGTVTSVADSRDEKIPRQYSLSQNYPNPFNPVTTIRYELPLTDHVSLKVYDVLGNEVATLVNENKMAGKYSVSFDGSTLSSGVYLYRLTAGEFTETKRLVLMK